MGACAAGPFFVLLIAPGFVGRSAPVEGSSTGPKRMKVTIAHDTVGRVVAALAGLMPFQHRISCDGKKLRSCASFRKHFSSI
jgi:hypothetical protein